MFKAVVGAMVVQWLALLHHSKKVLSLTSSSTPKHPRTLRISADFYEMLKFGHNEDPDVGHVK